MLYYFRIPHGNFGDALNPWLWSKLIPEACNSDDPTLFLAIGTILSRRVPAEPRKVLFGSGCGINPGPILDDKWAIYGVRGPRTAAKLGIDPSLVLADPAILIRRIPLPSFKKRYPISLMLHHQSAFEADWAELAPDAGVHWIDPRSPVDQVLQEIQETELLVTEAMHGAIVADALRVPWIPVQVYGQFVEFKWRDWTESLDMPLEIQSLPPIYQRPVFSKRGVDQAFKAVACSVGMGKSKWERFSIFPSSTRSIRRFWQDFDNIARNTKPFLSSDSTIRRTDERLFETLNRIRDDWKRNEFVSSRG